MFAFLVKFFTKEKKLTAENQRSAYGKLSGFLGILANLLLFGAKLFIGTLSGSVSITADAVNNLTDASGSIVTLLGFRLAEKPADKEHPYGHARMEYLAGLLVTVLIFFCGYELAKSSVGKIIRPEPVEFSLWVFVVLLLSIAVKFIMMLGNKRLGEHLSSQTLLATSQDSRNDVIATSAVLVSCLIGHFTKLQTDGYMGLLVALFIFYSGFCLAKETMDPLLGAAPDPKLVQDLSETLLGYEHILDIHDLMVHDYGPGRRFASVHVEMDKNLDPLFSHNIIDQIERDVFASKKLHLVIHYDPVTTDDKAFNETKKQMEEIVTSVDERLSIHDFRMVPGPLHTNVIFDLVIPFSLEKKETELKETIVKLIRSAYPDYFPVICIDNDAFNRHV